MKKFILRRQFLYIMIGILYLLFMIILCFVDKRLTAIMLHIIILYYNYIIIATSRQ